MNIQNIKTNYEKEPKSSPKNQIDKEDMRILKFKLSHCIEVDDYLGADSIYIEMLTIMSKNIHSYNSKLSEYINFLFKYFSCPTVTLKIKQEINRLLNSTAVPLTEKYSLYTSIALHFEQHELLKDALYWYSRSYEITQVHNFKSNKIQRKMKELSGSLECF